MKKLIALLMAAMMILGLAACNDGTGSSPAAANDASAPAQESAAPADKDAGPVRIAFISPAMHYDFFAYLAAAAKKTAEENGAQIDVFDAKEDFTQVAEFISHAVAQKYDVICTAGFEPIIPAVAEANAAGIPLINFDARLMGPGDFYARVSSDNKELGKLDGEYVRGLIEQRTDTSAVGFNSTVKSKGDHNVGKLFQLVQPHDLLKFGIIPELVGRLPVIAALDGLNREDLVRILTEPKNALVKQYQKLFSYDDVKLVFEPDALEAVADKAIERNIGARGLRAVMEGVLTPIMYDIPSDHTIEQVTITAGAVNDGAAPVILRDPSRGTKNAPAS